ncbi:MAG TPA: Hsp20/alpha crystallin family protein [Fimbriimonadales bacterium]|nr:Hsp20/alpha crystallin family protein [Fimbriimonadales bacterium]
MLLTRKDFRNTLERFRAFDELASRLFDEMFRDVEELSRGWVPKVDVKETPQEFTIYAELPGVKKEDIEVEMVGDTLTIRGKREFSEEERREDFVRIERSYGEFQRAFTLGVPVKADAITCTYRDGVLKIVVPKSEAVQPKKIPVKVESAA